MTALDRARGWFIAPPPPPPSPATSGWSAPPTEGRTAGPGRAAEPTPPPLPSREPSSPRDAGTEPPPADSSSGVAVSRWEADTEPAPAEFAPPSASHHADSPSRADRPVAAATTFAPPSARRQADPESSSRAGRPAATASTFAAPSASYHTDSESSSRAARPAAAATTFAPPSGPGGADVGADRRRRGKRPSRPRSPEPDLRGGWQPPVPGEWVAPAAAIATVTSAAVLGRAGDVEPVAAALALALRLQTRAKAAAVAVVGDVPPEVDMGSAAAAARRLAARLEAHGLAPHARGRLAWVELDADDPQLVAAARRVTLVGAPAVLAVTSARTAAVDQALNEQDLLVIVSAEPDGPLAQLAAAGLADVPILTVRPLGRGPARALARAGLRTARPIRQLLTTPQEVTE